MLHPRTVRLTNFASDIAQHIRHATAKVGDATLHGHHLLLDVSDAAIQTVNGLRQIFDLSLRSNVHETCQIAARFTNIDGHNLTFNKLLVSVDYELYGGLVVLQLAVEVGFKLKRRW